MDTSDWRSQYPSDTRTRIVNEILETLTKVLPFSGPEGLLELRRIAVRFEEKIFSGAVNQTDYLDKISLKKLTMETKSQNAAGSSSSVFAADDNSLPLVPGHLMDNNNWRPSLPNGEPTMDTGDWRTQLPPDSRQKIVNKIMETLKKHLPFSGPEGINELRRIAATFEEKIFSGAVNPTDYLRKISMKMLTMETKSQNAAGSSSSVFAADDNGLPLVPEPSLPTKEPAVNTGDWRTQQPPDSRQKNVNALMETLKKHVPHPGQEGIDELMRLVVSFEELTFNAAISQEDYLGGMQTMEEGD